MDLLLFRHGILTQVLSTSIVCGEDKNTSHSMDGRDLILSRTGELTAARTASQQTLSLPQQIILCAIPPTDILRLLPPTMVSIPRYRGGDARPRLSVPIF